jgi:hypothetical protein
MVFELNALLNKMIKNQNTLKLGVHSTPNRAMQNKKAG